MATRKPATRWGRIGAPRSEKRKSWLKLIAKKSRRRRK